jgi:membrane associated rhomboid family serine protease
MAPRINIPPVTRILLIAIVALSLLYNVGRWKAISELPDRVLPQNQARVPYLILVPAKCLYYPWTFVLTTFVEQNILTLVVNLATVYFGGRYLERAWGSKGFAIAFFVAGVIPNLIAAPMYVVWGAIMGNATRALTPISGGITIQAAFLVAFKQLVPEHTVSIFRGFVKMRVKHFPAVFLLANTLSGLILGTDTAAIFAWVGLITFWIYLRFYKRQPDLSGTATSGQGAKGDASETFAFATFFPDKIQPPIAVVCDQIFILLCNIKVCVPFSEEAVASGNEQVASRGEGGLPSLLNPGRGAKGIGKREEAERRRTLALKALDQRLLANSSRASTGPIAIPDSVQPLQEALAQGEHTLAEA